MKTLAQIPLPLIAELKKPYTQKPTQKNISDGSIKEGARNTTIFQKAIGLRKAGMKYDLVREFILKTASTCDPPLGESEALGCLDSAFKYQINDTSNIINTPLLPLIKLDDIVMSAVALESYVAPKREMLLTWLEPGSINMIAALRGLGKTMLALKISTCVALGISCFHWEVNKPAGVLYVDGEMNITDMQKRLDMLFENHPRPTNFYLLHHSEWHIKIDQRMEMASETFQKLILDFIKEHPDVKLVVFDNLSCLTSIREDKSDDWRQMIAPFLRDLKRLGIAVLLVHHANKAGAQRGTNAREDELSVSIMLEPVDDDANQGAAFKVKFVKTRGDYGTSTQPFIARLTNGSWTTEQGESSRDRLLAEIRLAGEKGLSNTQAIKLGFLKKSNLSHLKDKLVADGLISFIDKRMYLQEYSGELSDDNYIYDEIQNIPEPDESNFMHDDQYEEVIDFDEF